MLRPTASSQCTVNREERAGLTYGSCSYGKWLERRAETMRGPATEEEVDTMVTWMEGQRGGNGSCVEEWPDIDEMDAAWEAAMRSLVPLSLRDPNNADDFY